MVVTLGQQFNGEKRTVMLYAYINRHAETPDKNRNNLSKYIVEQVRNNILFHRLLRQNLYMATRAHGGTGTAIFSPVLHDTAVFCSVA